MTTWFISCWSFIYLASSTVRPGLHKTSSFPLGSGARILTVSSLTNDWPRISLKNVTQTTTLHPLVCFSTVHPGTIGSPEKHCMCTLIQEKSNSVGQVNFSHWYQVQVQCPLKMLIGWYVYSDWSVAIESHMQQEFMYYILWCFLSFTLIKAIYKLCYNSNSVDLNFVPALIS